MANYPYIKLQFEDDNTVQNIERQFIVNSSLSFEYKLLNGLEPSSNKIRFQLTKNCPSVEKILNSKKDIKAEVSLWDYDQGTKNIIFTGYISSKFSWSISDHGKSLLNVMVEDVGTRLLKKTYTQNTSVILKGKASDVLNTICAAAGITRADTTEINTQVCMVVEKGKKYEEIIKDLVKENLYTYYFDAYGRLALKNLRFNSTNDYIIDHTNLYNVSGTSIQLNKAVKQYGTAEVKWKEYETLMHTSIFRDNTGRDEKHPNCYIKVPGNSFYPSKDNGKPANIKVTDLASGKDIVYFENADPNVNVIGDITYTIEPYNYESLSVLFTNNSPIEGHIINCECYGDLTVIKSENTSTAGDLDFESYKTEAKWIHTSDAAKEYAEYLANYYKYCNQSYKFYSNKDMELGKICNLKDESFSGLDTRVLLTAKKWKLDGTYEYYAVGISQFDILDVTEDGIQAPSIVPGQPGMPGKGIDVIIHYYAVNNNGLTPPTNWNTYIPELTPENKYLWGYIHTEYTNGDKEDTVPGVLSVMGRDGITPVQITPSFDTYVYPATSNLISADEYAKMQCLIKVEQFPDSFTIGTNPLADKEFYITATGHGITNVTVENDIVKTNRNSIMPASSAYIEVIVHYKNAQSEEGTIPFRINLSKANSGLDGQYIAYEYALSNSREIAPVIGWSNIYPDELGDQYLWYRQQTVLPGNNIDPNNWSTPHLSEGNVNKVYKDLNVVADKIAFTVSEDGKVYSNSPNGATLEIGTTTEGGYILLDAANIIATGTVTSNQINTDELYSNTIKVGNKIVSGGYAEVDNSGNINPKKLPGFYADEVGKVKMIDAEIKGTIDSDILTTINGIPRIDYTSLKSEYQSFWNNATSTPDIKEWYNTGKITNITGAYIENNPSYANGRVFLGVGISDNQGLYEMGSTPYEWTKISNQRIKNIHYFDGSYYGWYIHTFYRSADGFNWSPISTVDMNKESVESVVMRNNIWIITSGDYANTSHNYYSTDKGTTWNPINDLNSKGYVWIYVVDDGANFYAYCSSGSKNNDVLKSSDGISWSKISSIDIDFDRHVSYTNGYYVSITRKSNDTWINYSTDNITWNQFKTPGPKAQYITYSNIHNKWVILTNEGYIFYSDNINGSYSAIYNKDLTYRLGFAEPIQTSQLMLIISLDETNSIRCIYSTKWSRSSIYNFFDSILPKIAPGKPSPTYEPLWDLQTCSGTFNYNGSSLAIQKLKTTPAEITVICNGTSYVFNKEKAIYHPFNISNLAIQKIAAIAYMGNTIPKNENVNLGSGDKPFRSVHASNLYGKLEGNVNDEGTRFTYRVWGAVAN